MLQFLYYYQYPCRISENTVQNRDLRHHCDVIVLVEKYDLPELRQLAAMRFKETVSIYNASDLDEVAREVYNETLAGNSLRGLVAEGVNEYKHLMYTTDAFRHWVAEIPELCTDLLFLQPGWGVHDFGSP